MLANRVGRVRGVEMKEIGRKGTHPERPAYHAKCLHGCPRVRVQLTRHHVDRFKDTHRERDDSKESSAEAFRTGTCLKNLQQRHSYERQT